MPVITVVYAALMIVLGVGMFLYTGSSHYTALIPAGFGLPVLVFGLLSFKGGNLRKHMMHGAAGFSLLGFLMPVGRLVPALIAGKEVKQTTMFSLVGMAILSLGFLIICIRSFIAARRARKSEEVSA